MDEIASKRGVLVRCSFEGAIRVWKAAGARLTPQETELIGEALWQGYRGAYHHPVRAMTDAQRNVKKSLVDGMAASLADLEVVVGLLRGNQWAVPAWLSMKDIRRALPPQRVAQLVSELAWIGGGEYAEPFLASLRFFYTNHGESLLIQREPRYLEPQS